jgi:uncharacterized membrane protein YgdD (TMEM256/DUF423 family)
MNKKAIVAGTLFAAAAVMLGAFGAHGLKKLVTPEHLMVYETGVRYHFYHSLALIVTGILYGHFPHKNLSLATIFFIIGILLFSGSLYAIVYTGILGTSIGPMGILTPIGGVFFILGWVWVALGVSRFRQQ